MSLKVQAAFAHQRPPIVNGEVATEEQFRQAVEHSTNIDVVAITIHLSTFEKAQKIGLLRIMDQISQHRQLDLNIFALDTAYLESHDKMRTALDETTEKLKVAMDALDEIRRTPITATPGGATYDSSRHRDCVTIASATLDKLDPEGADPTDELATLREQLGQMVRLEWISWARTQPNPSPSWLKPWDELSEPDKEVDRRIGYLLYKTGKLAAEKEQGTA